MEVFELIPYANETLTFEVRNFDATQTIAFDGAMSSTNAFGLYTIQVAVPAQLAPGNYYVRIFNDQGVNRKIGFMRVVDDNEYHFVNDFGDFEREPSAIEIEDELNNNFSVD